MVRVERDMDECKRAKVAKALEDRQDKTQIRGALAVLGSRPITGTKWRTYAYLMYSMGYLRESKEIETGLERCDIVFLWAGR